MKIEQVRIFTTKGSGTSPGYTISHIYINGEYACDCVEDYDRGLDQSMTLAEIRKRKVYKQTAIPTGTYELTMDIISPKFSQMEYYKKYCKGRMPRLLNVKGYDGILLHCLTPDMEILTEHGWKNYEQFKKEPEVNCFSYNTDTCDVELTRINQFIEQDYDGELYNCHGRVCYSVTDKHRMWVEVKKHGGEKEWQWRTADNVPTSSKFVTAAYKSAGWDISAHQKLLYRLIIAVQADGYILNWSDTASQVRFHFKKERKIKRIREILDEIGDQYKVCVSNDGKTHITLSQKLSEYITEVMNPNRNVYNTKELPLELLSLKGDDMKDLVMDYLFWDGRWENYLKNPKCKVISSTNKRTIGILQAMAFMCGFRTSIHTDERANSWNSIHDLKLYDNQEITMPEAESYGTESYYGKVWCVSNDNHTIIVRQNGHVSVLGNCGVNANSSAGCIIVGLNTIKGCVTSSKATWEKLMKQYFLPAWKLGEKMTYTITRKYKV